MTGLGHDGNEGIVDYHQSYSCHGVGSLLTSLPLL